MMSQKLRPSIGRTFVIALSLQYLLFAGPLTSNCFAYTPEDPEVREMVDRGVKFLEGLSAEELKATPYGGEDGQVVLAALAHLKAEHNDEAPLVQLGLKHAMLFVDSVRRNGGRLDHKPKSTYEVSVVILFFAELDSSKYAAELKTLGDALFGIQMSHGGYGYPGEPHGDVSQSQYIVLAMWTLDRAKIEIPLSRAKTLLNWLMRVQDISGSWPYRGNYPPGNALIAQPHEEMSVSTSLAGGGGVLIMSDIFRLWGQNTQQGNGVEGLPKAVRRLEQESLIDSRRKQAPVQRDQVLAATGRMDAYRKAHPFERAPGGDWYYYMMYSLERYESFMELALGQPTDPTWYDVGVRDLKSFQDANGGWGVKDRSKNSAGVSTSFAILFLIRSTKKAIGLPSVGSLAGGYGLPSDTTKITVKGTQINGEPTSAAVTDLLDLLEADDAKSMDQSSIPEDLKLHEDPAQRRTQLSRLERVLRGSESWQARRVAARVLGNSDDLSVVPTLIFALSDPDKPTRRFALDGLRFISRQFDSGELPESTEASAARPVQRQWAAWYQKVYPGYLFVGDEF